MTTHPDTQNDLQDLEAQFRSELVLSPESQDLLFREARTANTFTDEPVTEEQVRAIYDLAKWAPTSMNNQPLRIVLVRSPEARGRLVETHGRRQQGQDLDRPAGRRSSPPTRRSTRSSPRIFPHFPGAARRLRRQRRRAREGATFNATLQVGLLHPRRPRRRAGRRSDDRLRPRGAQPEFFADGEHRVLTVVNIGKPGEYAWFDRLPRLDYDEVVTHRLTLWPAPLRGCARRPDPLPVAPPAAGPSQPAPSAVRRAGRFVVARRPATAGTSAPGDFGCRPDHRDIRSGVHKKGGGPPSEYTTDV